MNSNNNCLIEKVIIINTDREYSDATRYLHRLNITALNPDTNELKVFHLDNNNAENSINEFKSFIGNYKLVCYDKEQQLINTGIYLLNIKNIFMDIKELLYIIEPWRKDSSLELLFNEVIKYNKSYNNVNKVVKLQYIINAILCRLWKMEEGVKKRDTLYNVISSDDAILDSWEWKDYLIKPLFFVYEEFSYVNYDNDEKVNQVPRKMINIKYSKYEELLRNIDIWDCGEKFPYEFRENQLEISRKIRENFLKNERIFIEAPTGSGKTFAYVLIVAIATFINSTEKRVDNSSFVISTDTKELQNQLIEKDIPNILEKLNLADKIRYGAMKGKLNYLCMERVKHYNEYEPNLRGALARIFIYRLIQSGEYGDIENINLWAKSHFELDKYFNKITCDSEKCNLDKCVRPCYLRSRYEELPFENITVINHSLLASWPYSEKKKIHHLIIDEAHNLIEKCYDFFSEEFNTNEFFERLNEIEKGTPDIFYMLRKLNAEYGYKENIDRNSLFYARDEVINNIFLILDRIKKLKLSNDKYNFVVEYYNPPPQYKDILIQFKPEFQLLRVSIYRLWSLISNYIKNIVMDEDPQGDSDYKLLMNYSCKLREAHDVIDNFITASKEQAKTLEIDKELKWFKLVNTPLQVGALVNDYLLKEVKSTAFMSATLTTNGTFSDIKNHLGQKEAKEFRIPAIFNLKRQTKIFLPKDIGSYKNDNFTTNSANFIFEVAKKLKGHTLVLFTNNYRRDEVYNELINIVKGSNTEVYTNKKAIKYLDDIDREVIILGTKGFFEGIDIPGDGLCCVILDKLPNYNIEHPILKAITTYYHKQYYEVNYPQLCIKVKQGYGRLIRGIMDYGYFIILDGGSNDITLSKLENDIAGPRIISIKKDEILNNMERDFIKWQNNNLRRMINSFTSVKDFEKITQKYKSFWRYTGKNKEDKLIFDFNKRKVSINTNRNEL